MPNWDDQFDFQDLDDNKKNNKNSKKTNNKKTNNDDDDFFDNDNIMSKNKQPQTTLPTINSRNSAKIKQKKQQSNIKQNPYASKNLGAKQTNNNDYDQDYQFEQEIVQEPVASKKQVPKTCSKQIPSNNNNKKGNNLQQNKSIVSDEYKDQYFQEDDFQQPIHQSTKNQPSLKNIATENKNKQKLLNLNDNKVNNNNKMIVKQKQPENEYDEDYQNDYENDDFQEQAKSPKKNNTSKNNEPTAKAKQSLQLKPNLASKNSNQVSNNINKNKLKQTQNRSKSVVPPKIPLDQKANRNPVLSNKNINKIQSHSINKKLIRNSSKKSIRSNDERSVKGSRISQKNQSDYFPNKHSDMVQKSFPHDQQKMNSLNQTQINKINEKMRAMIRKFNEQLNDLINKNMLLLKNKANQKQFNVDQRIRELQIQKKSGDTAIQVMEKDFQKLHGREGELKQQEYQLILQKQVQQKKNQIKQTNKQITVLKRVVDNKGKKLSVKQQQQKNAQNVHHLKTFLIQLKKDQQKSDQKIQKLTSAQEQLETKISDMDYKLQELISQARQKGVNIENTVQIQKRYEEIKAKLQNIKNFTKKSQALISTKTDIVMHQNQQIRITIRNINSQINNIYGSIDHSLNQSIRLIERAKQKENINPLFAQSLDKLLKQIEQSKTSNQYTQVRSELRSRRSDSARNQKITKKSSQQVYQKSLPLRVAQSQNQIHQNQQATLIKPKFTKNKAIDQGKFNIQNKNDNNQRIWKEQEQRKANLSKSIEQNKSKINNQNNYTNQKTQPIEQQKKDKSKPFSLKKNKQKNQNKNQGKSSKEYSFNGQRVSQHVQEDVGIKISKDLQIKQEPKKEQTTTPALGPRLMRFGKKKNNQQTSSNNIVLNDTKNPHSQQPQSNLKINLEQKKQQGLKLQIQPSQKQNAQNQQKAIFVPKRFNLRNKAQKKDDSYTPSVHQTQKIKSPVNDTKIQTKPKQTKQQQYKPKFDFKNEQFKIQQKIPSQKQITKPTLNIEQTDSKPKFNLRLRDRKNKVQEEVGGYMPSMNVQSKNQNKVQNKPAVEQKVINPYAPKNETIEKKQAPKNNITTPANNPYAPTNNTNTNQYAPLTNNNPYTPSNNNPYAPKTNNQSSLNIEPPKRQRGGLVKKDKVTNQNIPKQKFNIYAQAEDMTQAVKTIGGGQKSTNLNVSNEKPALSLNTNNESVNKKQQLSLNEMLGLKKQVKKNDFDDLLGEVGGVKTKAKKKNNDFFGDLQL